MVPESRIAYAKPMTCLPNERIINNDILFPSCVTSTAFPRWKAAKINQTTELENPSNEWWKASLPPLQSKGTSVMGFMSPQRRHSVLIPVTWSSHWNECVIDSRVRAVNTRTDISTDVVISAKIQLDRYIRYQLNIYMKFIPCKYS